MLRARLGTPRRQAAFLQERPEELQRQLRVTDRDALDQHRSPIGQLRGPEQLGGRIGGLDQPRRELQPLRFGGGSPRLRPRQLGRAAPARVKVDQAPRRPNACDGKG